jgi:hypothetical protein
MPADGSGRRVVESDEASRYNLCRLTAATADAPSGKQVLDGCRRRLRHAIVRLAARRSWDLRRGNDGPRAAFGRRAGAGSDGASRFHLTLFPSGDVLCRPTRPPPLTARPTRSLKAESHDRRRHS